MKDHVLTDDHQRTLVWLDDALEWARPGERERLAKFLDLVRTEILFDQAFSEGPPRDRTAVVGLDLDAEPGA